MSHRKFVFLINSLDAGGAERSLLELLPHLSERGVDTVVVTLKPGTVGFETEVRDAGHDVRTLSPGGRLGKIRQFRSLVKREQPDLVYTALFDSDLVGRVACMGLDVVVVSNLVNTAYDPVRLQDPNVDARRLKVVQAIDGLTARRLTDHFHAISETTKEAARDQLGIDPERVTVIPRSRDAARLGEPGPERRAAARRSMGIDDEAELLVSVGRQEYQKGHRTLIRAMPRIIAERPGAHLYVAGREGNSTADLRQLVTELEMGDAVTFLGHRDDVTDVLSAGDVFVFPSLYEGLGGSVIEAMAIGLPIVASDLPALREVVEAGENAILVPPESPDDLASAVVGLLADGGRRERYGNRSRTLFQQRFGGERNTADLVDLLISLTPSEGA